MDSGSIIKFISGKFRNVYNSYNFYTKIGEWLEWYKGDVDKFHKVRVSNGLTTPVRELYKLKMAKRVCEDWASSILNEDINIVVNAKNNKSSIFVQGTKGKGGVLGTNNFSSVISRNLELMFALGTSAIVLGLDNITVDENTNEIMKSPNAKIVIETYNAIQIFPISYKNGVITDVSFVSEFVKDNKLYYTISTHIKEEDGYVIYNDILDSSYNSLSLNVGVLPILRTKSQNPLFFIFKTNIVNNVDLNSPMGVSIYSDAIDTIKACDVIYDSCIRDVITGQRIVMMNKNLLTTAPDGTPIVPQDVKQSYMQFFGDDAANGVDQFIKEFAPKLNTTDLDNELQNQLNMLSNKCGLGTRFYNFNIASGVTATEYIGERNDFYRNAKKISNGVVSSIQKMVSEILFIGYNVMGLDVDTNAKVVVTISDGVVESDNEKREQDRKDVSDKLMSRVEYRMKWYGETEDEAKKALMSIDSETSVS